MYFKNIYEVLDYKNIVSHGMVYGLNNALRISGFPMRLTHNDDENPIKAFNRGKNLGNKDSISAEDNYLCGIVVQFDLSIPNKMWTEFQRYHFADIISSHSTMHRISQMDENSFDKNTPREIIDTFISLRDNYLNNKTKENYLQLLMAIPSGLILTAGVTTNYRQLKTMYIQRYNHRLPQWREFCKWILTLPYFKELTGIKEEMIEDDK